MAATHPRSGNQLQISPPVRLRHSFVKDSVTGCTGCIPSMPGFGLRLQEFDFRGSGFNEKSE